LYPGEVNEAARAAAGHVRPAAVAAAEEVPRRPELYAPVWIRWPTSRQTGHCRRRIAGSAKQQPDGPRSPVTARTVSVPAQKPARLVPASYDEYAFDSQRILGDPARA